MDSSNWYGGEYEMCKLIEKLKEENERLQAEIESLREQIYILKLANSRFWG